MNPAKEKRKRLFEAFNKQNVDASNLPGRHIKSTSKVSFLSPSVSRSSSIVSELYQDKTAKLQAEITKLRLQNENHRKKVEYHDKMECFYLSELSSLREKEGRIKRRMEIIVEELPSHKQKPGRLHLCENCHGLEQENSSLRNEIDLKNRVIETLESDLDYKQIEAQVLKRGESSLWREDTQEKEETQTLSRLTKESELL